MVFVTRSPMANIYLDSPFANGEYSLPKRSGRAIEIRYETKAIRDLKAIDAKDRARIVSKIVQYAAEPGSLANQIKHLVGSPFYRLRVGDYRVIFSLDGDTTIIMTVARVRHRREAYD